MQVYVDDMTAARAKELLDEFGMDMQTAVNIFLRQVIREKEFPFVISLSYERKNIIADGDDDFYSEANLSHLRHSLAQLEEGKVIVHDLIPVEE